ncbi:MAG: hypothetical protein ACHQNA_08875, partial [Acidimicrobiales bacterium]
MRASEEIDARPWRGPTRRYDLIKELVIALIVVTLLTVLLAAMFSSPDEAGVTLQRWARANPNDFVATAASELDGSSGTAGYGPPYNHNGGGQSIGPLHIQRWIGVHIPIDAAGDFVISPLKTVVGTPGVATAVKTYQAASDAQRQTWASNYTTALAAVPDGDPTKVASGTYGPVPALTSSLLGLAQSGALDSQLVNPAGGFYQDDYTKPLLFLADGSYLSDLAQQRHLTGSQWGMMNETGNFPGQPWLWLYTFWYQVSPFDHTSNGDALVWGVMLILSLALVLAPIIPGVRSIPRRIPIYRVIWRDYYRKHPPGVTGSA